MKESFIKKFLECGAFTKTAEERILIGWGKREWVTEPKYEDFPAFYFPDFFLTIKKPWFVHEHFRELSIEDFLKNLESFKKTEKGLRWQISGKEIFYQVFQELQPKFHAGELNKAVPYVFEKAVFSKGKIDPPTIGHLVRSVLERACMDPIYPYGFWDDNQGMVGGTPEILFKIEKKEKGTKISSLACAGTVQKGEEELLLKNPKFFYEHELVIQGIEESLKSFGKVEKGKLQILPLHTLSHLTTSFSVSAFKNISFVDVVKKLHPTPALGAFPKILGQAWLQNYQTKIARGRFGAPAGYYFPLTGEGECFVAIRNIQWDESEARIGAGCGIVSQSDFEQEWAEIQLKMLSIKNMICIN